MEIEIFEVDEPVLSKTLQVILDLLDDCILIVDKNGMVLFYNQANEKLDNLQREKVIGCHIDDCFKVKEQTSGITSQVLRKRIPLRDVYQDYTTISGNRVISVSSAYPLFHQQELAGVLTITKNIYRYKKLMNIVGDAYESLSKNEAGENYTFEQMIGSSSILMNSVRIARKAAKTNSSVLIYGDTGTGKELFAQSIHHASNLKGPFVSINCAAIPENLLESILFGTAKGAFTGAVERAGLFEEAANGTLFLDEINSMNSSQQAKLLRVLETGHLRRIGENRERPVHVRMISALNMSPLKAVEQGLLRQDLFYRLSVVSVRVPPLTERKEDIPLLTKFFIDHYNRSFNLNVRGVSADVAGLFQQYRWPGNVRELRHAIEYAMNLIEDSELITREDLSPLFFEQIGQGSLEMTAEKKTLKTLLEDVELAEINAVLHECKGNVNEAARRLGVSRQNLDYKLKKYHLDVEQ